MELNKTNNLGLKKSPKKDNIIHMPRVAKEIKEVGLYNMILQDVCNIAKKSSVSEDEILKILKDNPQILRDYKQLNVEYNLSNIHLKNIDLNGLNADCKSVAKKVNKNLNIMREIEKYTLDFEQSSTLVIIFSVEFFVLFSVQYFIVLLNLKDWQWWIYGIFALSIAIAWQYAKKERKKFEFFNKKFEKLYDETNNLIDELVNKGCINLQNLIIKSSDEHI